MSKINDQPVEQGTESEKRSRMIYRTGVILIVAPSFMLLHYAYLLNRYDVSRLIIPMTVMVGVILVSITSVFLNRRGKSVLAARLLVASPLIVAPVVALSVTDSGFVLGIAATIASVQIATQTMPRKQIGWVMAISIAVGMSTVMLDLFWPGYRQTIPEDRIFVPVAAFVVVVVLGFSVLRQFGSYPLRTKLMTSTFAMAALAVGATTFFVNRTTSAILTQSVGRDLNSVAESQALAVGELLGRQTALLQLLSGNQALHTKVRLSNAIYPAGSDKIQAQLQQLDREWAAAEEADSLIQGHLDSNAASELLAFQARFPAFFETFVTDRYGALQASTHRTSSYSQAGETWWQAAYDNGQGSIYIGPAFIHERFEILAIDIAVPMVDLKTDEIVGVLRSTYGLRDLVELLASSTQLEQDVDLLLPSDQLLAAGATGLEDLPSATLAQLRAPQDDGFASFDIKGNPSLVSHAVVNTIGHVPTVDALGWTIVAHQAQARSLAVVEEQQRSLILIGMAALVVTSIAAAVVARNITGPIVRLTETARLVAAGDLFARAEVKIGDEIGVLANTFNTMAAELHETLTSLERRVAERTHALETSIEVSRSLSNILSREQLVAEVVDQLRAAFGYYHAHIYLLEGSGEDLVMVGGTGEAGQEMLHHGHKIPMGKGLVGRAATTNNVVLAPDVIKEKEWLPNPLLPDTRSEIAAPIAIGEQVLGVIDVQHDVVDALNQEDVRLLRSVSGQVAIALRNASLYEQARHHADREALINEINLKIRAAHSVEDVLQIAADELGQALGTESASVQLSLSGRAVNGKQLIES
jgi:putative methionine-R-sulfoxide reductase with GAF domain